ncbi:cytohesin-1 isoform X1 [Drosophila santomea]|uniref:cytohesin-1 isoform X1 n=1 Tax=Drosophila santomea TaxID=129105 RepID=UPI0019532E72|nr:cytohesin-1 isoform X1 [Drosophila santomea]
MASLHQRRPSISNWFSSLRRQPKNKKCSSGLGGRDNVGKKPALQRSCFDLSATPVGCDDRLRVKFPESRRSNSTFYINTGNVSSACFKDNRKLLVERDSRSDSSPSSICVRCSCNLITKSGDGIETYPITTPKSDIKIALKPPPKPRSPSIAPYTSVATYNITKLAPDSPPPASPTLSTQTVNCSNVTSKVTEVQHLPCDEPNTELISRRTEYKNTTITTTTRTLIVTRPIEVLLNENGEIIARRSPDKTRSNFLGRMLDVNNEIETGVNPPELFLKNYPCSKHSSPLTPDTCDMRFIDDSSNLQSESERNSIIYKTNKYNSKNKNNNRKRDSLQSNLCESCHMLLEQNCINTERSHNLVNLRRPSKQIKDELCEVVSEMEALDVPDDCKHSNKDKQMSIGRKKFNMDPKKGIEYLVENRLLRHDPQDVAHFLYKGEGLNKTAIGDYLGEKNDFNEDVLKAFVALHDFTNLILVQALRQFLWSFRLPGEAQKIDRMMETFAQRYCQLNPDIFTNTDTCYVLSFAIIMLNTSLHNPSVKDKPTVDQFISMNRGINNGGDLPRGLLESLYESIRTEPFKIPQDDGNDLMHTFFNPDKEGWLWKQGGRYKSWKRRWFILNDNCLYYFEYTTDKEPRGIIPLENISVREIHDRSKPHCFELFATGGADIIKACKTDSEGKVVEGKHTVYRMSAATEEDQQEWIKRLTQSISHNPFYDILVQRKKKALSKS